MLVSGRSSMHSLILSVQSNSSSKRTSHDSSYLWGLYAYLAVMTQGVAKHTPASSKCKSSLMREVPPCRLLVAQECFLTKDSPNFCVSGAEAYV